MTLELLLIAAVARNGVIGGDNRLLWHLPEDMRFFKQTTLGHAVIMGRKTWQSLPPRFRPLPGRRNIVLTRDAGFDAPGAEVAASLQDAIARVAGQPLAFVIGGAEVYAQALPLAQQLWLTEIDHDFDGDAHFPAWPRQHFVELERTHHDSGQGYGYQRAHYRRER
ncbi:MAG TPA: dihydrofolate reductase [Rubrivivax sp.]|nr:dihydrofolate reductase [Rubrivivax sp.]